MRSNIWQDIHNRGVQFKVGKFFLYLPIYSKMYDIV